METPEWGNPTFDMLPAGLGPSTRLVHGARRPEKNAGAVVTPIYQTSTFHYPFEFNEAEGRDRAYHYSRYANPNPEAAAELVRLLEGGQAGFAFGSGMGAIATTLLALLQPGDEVVALESLYGGTLGLMGDLLARYGITTRFIPDVKTDDPARAVQGNPRVVYIESPTNPCLRVVDIAAWARAAHRSNAILVVDNTFATPVNQTPLALGADIVLHSATKYLGGHHDLMAGVVVGPANLIGRVTGAHRMIGSVLDPFAAFLLARGLRTLAVRVARHNENGGRVATVAASHRQVRAVHYPGRDSPREEEIASRQMTGRGGMVTIDLEGGQKAAHRFMRELKLVHVAASLGGVGSLVSLPVETSHAQLSPEALRSRGITEGMVRLSLGIEDPADLESDVRRALNAL